MEDDRDPFRGRRDERQRRLLKAQMLHPRHGQVDILVRDVSRQGIGGRCDLDLAPGEAVTICLPSGEQASGRVAWRKGLAFGIRADAPIASVVVRNPAAAAGSTYHVPDRFQPISEFRRPGFRHRIRDR